MDALSEKLKISRAALVREAISEYLDRNRTARLDDTFGLWKHSQVDGVDYQRTLRDEWGE
ncbi:MAG: ribbon-helix-helix domain-containing protein [Trueperaceae bacterium]